jgi:hypothetical protein
MLKRDEIFLILTKEIEKKRKREQREGEENRRYQV